MTNKVIYRVQSHVLHIADVFFFCFFFTSTVPGVWMGHHLHVEMWPCGHVDQPRDFSGKPVNCSSHSWARSLTGVSWGQTICWPLTCFFLKSTFSSFLSPQMIRVCWLFYFSKFIELLDTVRNLPFSLFAWHRYIYFHGRWPELVPLFIWGVLCAEEKAKPDHIPPRVPSLLHALDVVVGPHTDSWWGLRNRNVKCTA